MEIQAPPFPKPCKFCSEMSCQTGIRKTRTEKTTPKKPNRTPHPCKSSVASKWSSHPFRLCLGYTYRSPIPLAPQTCILAKKSSVLPLHVFHRDIPFSVFVVGDVLWREAGVLFCFNKKKSVFLFSFFLNRGISSRGGKRSVPFL